MHRRIVTVQLLYERPGCRCPDEANRAVQAIVVTTPWFNNDASDRKNHHASRLYVRKLCHPGRDEQDSLRKRVVGGDGSLTESHRYPSRFWLPEQMQQQMSH